MFGSGNWDERSMRLNFEFNVETYDAALAARLDEAAGPGEPSLPASDRAP